ncbi:MAG: hypothetical protein E7298_01990 [Lachnospiraceae bacterium]|jgi:hypothetical protein|nr:hypothetical protein [Lachnospiraceae bacterium]
MSKNNNNKNTDKNMDDHSKERKIRQVFPNGDVSGNTESPKDKEGHPKEEKKKDTIKKEENAEALRAIRIVSVIVAMIFSLLFAMAGGVGLALWDEGRTISELNMIVFAKEMDEAVADTSEADESAISIADAEEAEPQPEPVETEEIEPEEGADESDYGLTISADTDGVESITKAGSSDEIELAGDDEIPEVLDPLADYPVPFTTVDESYFTDALFIGDSRLQGFGFWSGIPATYYCATGFHVYKYETTNVVQTENGKVPIFEAMPYDAFTKVYIKVGLNELGYGTEENFEKTYAELIAKIREYEPRAIIFVHAILPVTAEKSNTDKAHNNANIAVRNAALEQFAKEQKAYFIDAGPALSDAEGNLRPEMTSDGIHLKPEYMKLWRDFLCEHGVVIN